MEILGLSLLPGGGLGICSTVHALYGDTPMMILVVGANGCVCACTLVAQNNVQFNRTLALAGPLQGMMSVEPRIEVLVMENMKLV